MPLNLWFLFFLYDIAPFFCHCFITISYTYY